MKIATTVARLILGFVFLVFGLNGFLHFIPMPPLPAKATEFFGGLAVSGYLLPLLFGVQAVGGALLLGGVLVPLALTLLAPIVVNILLFHLFLDPAGGAAGYVATLLQLFLMWQYRDYYRSLFVVRAYPAADPRHTPLGRMAATIGLR